MSYEYLYEAIHQAGPGPNVAAALEDNVEAAGIVTHSCEDALVGSRLFNVATAALGALRTDPEAPVIENPLDILEPDDWLARFTFRILNDSIKRPNYAKLPQFSSAGMPGLGTCPFAEEAFGEVVSSAADSPADEAQGKVFIDSQGRPILLTKYSGEPSTLTFKAVQINKIRLPAGTLLNLEESGGRPSIKHGNLLVEQFDPKQVAGVAALRFTAFAFLPADRPRIMKPVIGDEPVPTDNSAFDTTTLSDVISALPDQKTYRTVF
jgi:hypothetical protein